MHRAEKDPWLSTDPFIHAQNYGLMNPAAQSTCCGPCEWRRSWLALRPGRLVEAGPLPNHLGLFALGSEVVLLDLVQQCFVADLEVI